MTFDLDVTAAGSAFTATRVGAKEVVFENPSDDFPQRILYRLGEDGTLAGRIEGTDKGHPRGIDFPMRRVACPGLP